MYDFEFSRPETLEQAVTALQDEDTEALAGGQTLLPTMKQRLAMPTKLVSLTAIPDMRGVCTNDAGQICIGATTSHAQVAAQATAYRALAELAGGIGDPAVRNRGTIGGSLANNDPAACYPAAVLASGALILTNKREIPADDYFDGLFGTALEEGELIVEVRFPVPEMGAYAKFSQPASRFALTGVFVARFNGAVRVAVTGASEGGVFRWTDAEEALLADFTPAALDALTISAEDMINDLHGSAAYRANLVKVMTKRAVAKAAG